MHRGTPHADKNVSHTRWGETLCPDGKNIRGTLWARQASQFWPPLIASIKWSSIFSLLFPGSWGDGGGGGRCSLSQLILGERQDPAWMSSSQDQHNKTHSHWHLRTIQISICLSYQQTLSVLKKVQLNRMSCTVTCKSFKEVELSFFQHVLCMDCRAWKWSRRSVGKGSLVEWAVCACMFGSAALFGELFLRCILSGGAHTNHLLFVVSVCLKRWITGSLPALKGRDVATS